jgi:PhzF family phenazine biosynthesis protein
VKQDIASEFNLSETAFVSRLRIDGDYKTDTEFGLRWFTPTNEVPLCGHATLATAAVLFAECGNI